MPRGRVDIAGGLGIAAETGHPAYVIHQPAGSKRWQVVECRPDGTTAVVEEGITSSDKASTARIGHEMARYRS